MKSYRKTYLIIVIFHKALAFNFPEYEIGAYQVYLCFMTIKAL